MFAHCSESAYSTTVVVSVYPLGHVLTVTVQGYFLAVSRFVTKNGITF
jgi:hypothetical protein